MAVPEYRGQPGTLVLGGARPPPQSRKSQSSPVPGTYQAMEAPAGEETSVEVQPVKSVRASATETTAAEARRVVRRSIVSREDGTRLLDSSCWSSWRSLKNYFGAIERNTRSREKEVPGQRESSCSSE